MRGPSKVDTGSIRGRYGVHPRSIQDPSEVDTGSIRSRYGVHPRSIQGPSEVDTGSIRGRYRVHPRSIRGPSEADLFLDGRPSEANFCFSIFAAAAAAAGAPFSTIQSAGLYDYGDSIDAANSLYLPAQQLLATAAASIAFAMPLAKAKEAVVDQRLNQRRGGRPKARSFAAAAAAKDCK